MKFRSNSIDGLQVEDNGQWRRLCGHVRVKAHLAIETSNKKLAQIEVWDRVNRQLTTESIPFENLHKPSKLMDALISVGFEPPAQKDRACVATYLAEAIAPSRRLVSQIGWYEVNQCFVLPNKTIGNSRTGDTVEFDHAAPVAKADYSTCGTIKDWKKYVAGPCGDSSRAVTAICAGLAGVTLEPLGAENFGQHISGTTSSGKSSLLCGVRSVGGRGTVDDLWTWDNTDTAYEEAAEICNSGALIIDETQLAGLDEKTLLKKARSQAYKFVQGQPRSRSRRFRNTEKSPPRHWHAVLLSAGEDSFWSLGTRNSDPRRQGEVHRLIDLPAVASIEAPELGIFERCPSGYKSTAEAAEAIMAASGKFYGWPLRRFVSRWIMDSPAAIERMRKKIEEFIRAAGGGQFTGWERRFLSRFAIIFAAGSLASDWKIFPWSRKHIGRSVLKCYRDARALLEEQYPQPDKLLRSLQRRIVKGLARNADISPLKKTVLRQTATDKHKSRILVRGSLLRSWFPAKQADVLLTHVERFLLKPPSRHCRTIQVRRGGKKRDFYAFRPSILKSE